MKKIVKWYELVNNKSVPVYYTKKELDELNKRHDEIKKIPDIPTTKKLWDKFNNNP